MLAWIHRNLPIVLASILSVLVHTAVLFPLIEVLGSGRFNSDRAQKTLGRELPGLKGPERDRETDRIEHREKQVRRKLTIRKIQEEIKQREPEPEKPDEKQPDPVEPEPELEERVELGIDESDAVTMNWIGFSEYEKHLAALAEVEQAALRLESSSGSRGDGPSTLPPTPPTETVATSPQPAPDPAPSTELGSAAATETTLVGATSPAPSAPAPATAATTREEPANSDALEEAAAKAVEETSRTDAPADAAREEPVPAQPDAAVEPTDVPDLLARPADDPRDGTMSPPSRPLGEQPRSPVPPLPDDPRDAAPSGADLLRDPREGADRDVVSPIPPSERVDDAQDPTVPPDRTETVGPSNDAAAQSGQKTAAGGALGAQTVPGTATVPNQPAPSGAPGDARSDQGRLSTRESDPTSTIDVPQAVWQFGAPLARKGVRLDTVRPRFSTLNLIDGIRFNPIVELVIGRDGVPQHVVISRSTGNLGANEELRAALYKWRASGKQIEQLKPGQTITIRLRLIMLAD